MKNTRLRTRIASFFFDRIRRDETAKLNTPLALKMETNPFYTPHDIERAIKMCISAGVVLNDVDGLLYRIKGKEGVPFEINQIQDYSGGNYLNQKGNFFGEIFARPYPNESYHVGKITLNGNIQALVAPSRYTHIFILENTSTANTVKFGLDAADDSCYHTLQKSERIVLYDFHSGVYVKGTIGDVVVYSESKPLGT